MGDDTPIHSYGQFIPSGVPGLDELLGGGLLRGNLVLLVGPPGAGKTIMAQQAAFRMAADGENVLFLTGFSEPHDKLLAHIRSFTFFDPARIGANIRFASLVEFLRAGADETEDAIVTTALRQRAKLVVLDGYQGIRRAMGSDQTSGEFLYALSAKLGAFGATTVITSEGEADNPDAYPELTTADTILAVRRERVSARHRRLIEVVKARGAVPLTGEHPFVIAADGVTVYPRLEAVVTALEPAWTNEQASFGIPAVDELLRGGLTVGTTTVAAGNTGAGKTLLGLHFIVEGARSGVPSLFVGMAESATQLRHQASVFGLDLAGAEASGLARLIVLPGYDIEPDAIAALVRDEVRRRGVRRIVIDSATELERATAGLGRSTDYLTALVAYLRGHDVTTYLTLEVADFVGRDLTLADSPLAVLAENLLLLRQVEYQGELRRLFSVLKARFMHFDATIREYTIHAERGLVMTAAPAAVGLLTGTAQPLPRSNGDR